MKTKLLFTFLVAFFSGTMLIAQDYETAVLRISDNGDTLVIKPTSQGGGVNCVFYAIMGDTATDGTRNNPDRIYKTVRGGVYIYDGPANLDNTVPNVQIVADDGTTQPPLHVKTVNGAGNLERAMFAYYGDMYFKNQYLSNVATNNALDRGMFDTKGTDQTVTFDNCIIEMSDWTIIMNWAVGLSVKMTNCFVHNIGKEASLEKGVLIDGQSSMRSLYLENNTFLNIGYIVWRRESHGIADLYVNHNTIVNSAQNPFQIYTQAYQVMTNNMFINTGVVPDYPGFYPGMEDEDALPKGIVNVDTVEAAMKTDYWEFDYPAATEADRKILVQSNNAWWNDKFATMFSSQLPAAAAGSSWNSQMITMNSRTQAMFDDDNAYPYFVESDWYDVEPDFTNGNPDSIDDALVQYVITNVDPENIGAGRAYPVWRTNLNTNLTEVDWPILADLSYANTTLKGGAINGYPLGDLNWFPNLKAQWETTGENAKLTTALEAGVTVEDWDVVSGIIPNKINTEVNKVNIYPNPIANTANIEYELANTTHVEIVLYSIIGEKVKSIELGRQTKGSHNVILEKGELSSGMYILQLNTEYSKVGYTTKITIK